MARGRDLTGFGEWLRAQRDQRRWTQDRTIAELQKLTAVVVTRNWLSQLENGDKPSDDLAQAFERLFGPFRLAPQPEPATQDIGPLVAAIDRLVEELRLSRAEAPEWVTVAVRASLAALQAAGEQPASAERSESGTPRRGQG